MSLDLFGHPELNRVKGTRVANGARRLVKMHTVYGQDAGGRTCKGCMHLVRYTPGARSFLKCELAGVTSSEASDWRAKWLACGLYAARPTP